MVSISCSCQLDIDRPEAKNHVIRLRLTQEHIRACNTFKYSTSHRLLMEHPSYYTLSKQSDLVKMKEETKNSSHLTDVETAPLNVKTEAADLPGSTSQAVIQEVPAQPRRSRRLAKPEVVESKEKPAKDTEKVKNTKDKETTRVLTKEEEAQGMLLKPLLIQGTYDQSKIDRRQAEWLAYLMHYQNESDMISGRCSSP
jgi:hypothetical protein